MPTISTTVIPFSANDLDRPGAGVEWWNGQDYADVPAVGNRHARTDYYFRFCWTDIEKVTQGNYSWSRFDQEANKAFAVGAKFSFGFMIVCDSDDFLAQEFFNGTSSRYPKYVHDHMQTQSTKDYVTNGQWIPVFNNAFFLDRFEAMMVAVRDHIIANGWQNRIGYVDIRGYGQWGEWHSVGFGQPTTSMPAGIKPTVATYKRIIDSHVRAFPDWQLVMMLAAMDANWLDNTMTPPEVTDYMLKASNNVGPIGMRRDQWGATDNYVNDYLQNNNRSFGSSGPFKDIIMERWKTSPWVGEPMGPGSNLSDLERQVGFYRATSFGNGNYTKGGTTDAQVRQAAKLAGYRLQIEGGSFTNTSNSVSVTLNWRNAGVTPTYENWDVQFILKNTSGAVAATATSTFKPRRFLPSTSTTSVTDNFNVSVPQGNYTLNVRVIDPKGYRKPMPLFINGVQSDGTYNLGNVAIGVTVPNQPPTVNAGPDRSTTLPTNTLSLTGTASDSDGTVTTVWSQVSGPNSAGIATPASLTTVIANLVAGTYVFQLRATDNSGASVTDTTTVVVSAAPNNPPIVSAGSDVSITLPTNSVQLTGTVTEDGTFTSVWSRVSGTGVISNPNNLTTSVTGLLEGTSTFRLTVTDNGGLVRSDDVSVVTKAAPSTQVPVANAGTDQKIITPNSTTQLVGSATGGTVDAWTWRKSVGPSCNLTDTNKSTAKVSGLQKGVYIFELRTTGGGGFTYDTVAVVVEEPSGSVTTIQSVTQTILYTNGTSETQIIS